VESSSLYQSWYASNANVWGDIFFSGLRQQDWLGLITFNLAPAIKIDFTQDKEQVRNAVHHLAAPSHAETNFFDAILDTAN
jgi:hypothetical protein